MTTDTPSVGKDDKHDAGKRKDAKTSATKTSSAKSKAKHAKPSKRASRGKDVTAIDSVKAAVGAVVHAASTPRGAAIGAAAATVGLIAGFVAVVGPRRIGKAAADATAAVTDRLPDIGRSGPAEKPAETIGAIMAKAAADAETKA